MKPDLTINLKEVKLKNPIILASGVVGFGKEIVKFFDINKLGAVVTKTITLKPRIGNLQPRIYDLGFGVLNSIGLENPGLEGFKEKYADFLSSLNTCVFVSLYGESFDEYKVLIRELENFNFKGYEINLSCPNIKKTLKFSQKKFFNFLSKLRELTKKLLVVKLGFHPELVTICKICENAGIDALTLINTLPAMAVDIEERKPVLGNITGGLSGRCLKPIALKCVWEVSRKIGIPVIGCGGIFDFKDVIEFLLCGACCIQIGTANLIDPKISLKILKDLQKYLKQKGINSIKEIIGRLSA